MSARETFKNHDHRHMKDAILPFYYRKLHLQHIYRAMKQLTGLIVWLAMTSMGYAQYYYKDIVITQQTIEKWKSYKAKKVRSVKLISYEADGRPTEGFEGSQDVSDDFGRIVTYTHTNMSDPTQLIAFYDASGLLKKTVDTSDTYLSTTLYEYDPKGHIVSISNSSLETDNQLTTSEKHLWQYNQDGIPVIMLKIKNGVDTTYIRFTADDNGNITQEDGTHNHESLPTVYYYYSGHTLTDIVRYNEKAARLLPDYMFEYDGSGHMTSMLFVQSGTNDYQKWIYQYNAGGLRAMDNCYNKRKELLGKIEYQYNYFK
jgi:hypothetical protein